ncbi:ABC transporter permease [Peptoniphilus stercorisuis]|uniref:Peptide/nickel transport system permease protein n=1 Tax=Peptoniphilus stercorisuis TaxID=1436965 RepID=A0ABS4KB26_9FIRM|nr:ABC transporter permease [Peptoniphilus stercorisuis]MBP2024968.1 peptide/nickel transport system permease protein [Peptoniphilus stercorisuis]
MKRILKKNKDLQIGLSIITILLLICIVSFFWTPYDPYETSSNILDQLQGPSKAHLFGTDHLGRDILSRIMIASQKAFFIGITTLLVAGSLGTLIGLVSGYVGGIIDNILMRIVDVFMTIPGTVLLLLFVTIFGRGTKQTVIAISIMNFTTFAKMTRSQVLYLKKQEHILWAKAVGVKETRIIFRHILPDLVPTLLVVSAMKFSSSVMAEAGLSYLGLGIQPPEPSWGNMLTRAQSSIISSPFTAVIPGLMITLFVIGFNLLSDGLRKALKVREAS